MVFTVGQLLLDTSVATTVSMITVFNPVFICVVFLQISVLGKLGFTVGTFELEFVVVRSYVADAVAFLGKFLITNFALIGFLATVCLVVFADMTPLSRSKPARSIRTLVNISVTDGLFWNRYFLLSRGIHVNRTVRAGPIISMLLVLEPIGSGP